MTKYQWTISDCLKCSFRRKKENFYPIQELSFVSWFIPIYSGTINHITMLVFLKYNRQTRVIVMVVLTEPYSRYVILSVNSPSVWVHVCLSESYCGEMWCLHCPLLNSEGRLQWCLWYLLHVYLQLCVWRGQVIRKDQSKCLKEYNWKYGMEEWRD